MTRFALAAVSPAVVVPGVLSLSRKGLGVAKGIPTLLIAASSIDDVLAITLYTICLSLAPSSTYRPAGQQEICLNPYVEKVQEGRMGGTNIDLFIEQLNSLRTLLKSIQLNTVAYTKSSAQFVQLPLGSSWE
jgi:hypothetical protein